MDVTPTNRTASREFYQAYLNSPAWRTQRNAALRRANWKCERCPSRRSLEVHHKTYERLGEELPQDLEVLCRTCHRDNHYEEARKRPTTPSGIHLKLASQAFDELGPLASISDLSDHAKRLCARYKIRYDAHQLDSALNLICGVRKTRSSTGDWLADANRGYANAADEITKDEAYEIVSRLCAAPENQILAIRQIPDARPVNARKADTSKALQIIFAEIAASIERAEALERQL